MLWERIPETHGVDRASTYYELSARIYARGQYDEALALAETARDIYSELGSAAPTEGLAQAYSAIGYNLNQLKRMSEAATAMSKAVELLRENKSPMALELACTLGEWWFSSKEFQNTIECMEECAREHLIDGNELGAEIAHCYTELGDAESALAAAQKAVDVFTTAHDHRRLTYASFELGKAQVLSGEVDEGLNTLERVLDIAADAEPKDFEFIVAIERRIAEILHTQGRSEEAIEIERRIASISEILED